MVRIVVWLATSVANLRRRHKSSTTPRVLLRNHILTVRGLRRRVVYLAGRLLLVHFVLEMLAKARSSLLILGCVVARAIS